MSGVGLRLFRHSFGLVMRDINGIAADLEGKRMIEVRERSGLEICEHSLNFGT